MVDKVTIEANGDVSQRETVRGSPPEVRHFTKPNLKIYKQLKRENKSGNCNYKFKEIYY